MLAWMAYVSIASAAIALAGAVAERGARIARLPTRWAWCATLGAILAGTALTWRTPANPPATKGSRAIESPVTGTHGVSEQPASRQSTRARPVSSGTPIDRIAALAWLALSSAIGALLVVSAVRLQGQRRSWKRSRVDDEDVLLTNGLGPAVVGMVRPTIALPLWVLDEPSDRRTLILSHEREHRDAGDQRVVAFAWLALVLVPWNIAVLWAIARLRHAIEIDCDARVMRGRSDLRSYAELLIDVSRRPTARVATLTAFAEPPSNVELRIMALTRLRPSRKATIGAILVAGAAIAIACDIPRPSGPGAVRANSQSTPRRELKEVAAPLPYGAAEAIRATLSRSYKDVASAGTSPAQAIWFFTDSATHVADSWAGPAYSDDELHRSQRRPGRDTTVLIAFTSELPAANGRPISVVWTMHRGREFTMHVGESESVRMLDSIRAHDPALYAHVDLDQIVYYAWDNVAKRVERIWAGPRITDRAERSRYINGQVPSGESMENIVTTLSLTAPGGRLVPVFFVGRTPVAKRH